MILYRHKIRNSLYKSSEAFQKAKEVIVDSVQQIRENVKSATESQIVSESNFTDLTALNKEKAAEEAPVEEATAAEEASVEENAAVEEPVPAAASNETVEEFFDDEDEA